ncbi:MAG TPA: hypothetical protein PLZ76_05100, partial [Bacillota bacterium]|nr:hypothetical protein [Bacillota bacterium]
MDNQRDDKEMLKNVESVQGEAVCETPNKEVSLADSVKIVSPGQMVLRRFFRSKLSLLGLVMLVSLFLFSFLGPVLSKWGEVEATGDFKWVTSILPHQITVQELNEETGLMENVTYIFYEVSDPYKVYSKTYPSWTHWLGTDQYGYDVVTRLMYGGRVSLALGFIVIFAEILIGIFMGALAGYFGGWVDQVIMRVVDIFN